MSQKNRKINTKVIHAGEKKPLVEGAVSLPIFQSSTFEYTGAESYHDLKYIRLNNTPNHEVLHAKLAALENAESALVTSSGMAAISTAMLTFVSPGDHILCQGVLYGGTYSLITHDLIELDIHFDFIAGDDHDSWKAKLKPETKLVYVETISNPLLHVPDLKAVTDFAKAHNLISLIDNTFATPVNFRPAEMGFDLSLHSCTKYLNGHSDIVAGAVIGRSDLVERIKHKLNHFGGTLDPHACFLLHRGIKTLAVRMAYQNESGLKIARFLDNHPKIETVYYPGLETHPTHRLAAKYLNGFSGMLSFELKGDIEEIDKFIGALQLPINAPSLGGVETLITRPCTTSHRGLTPEERQQAGVSDNLIRLSVGLEDPEDLIEDLAQALGS